MSRRNRRLLIGLGTLLALVGMAVARDMYITATTDFVVPMLHDGELKAVRAHERGFFATLVKPIYKTDPNAQQLYLTYFGVNEKPALIGQSQPEDAVVFSCPDGTNIPVSRAFSHFTRQITNQYVWGPYIGDEASRLQNGENPNIIFPQNKFAGRASGYPFVSASGSLVVDGYAPGEGLFFASAAVPAGTNYRVRCSIVQACGDYFVDSPEQCDEGGANSNTVADACRTNCQSARCGDGVVDTGEQCDDGNINNNDSCSNSCITQSPNPPPPPPLESSSSSSSSDASSSSSSSSSAGPPACGDGTVQGIEQCDDGNASNTDACLNNCTSNICGDAYVNVGTEQCDDGKTCQGTDINGNLIGSGNWCASNIDCSAGTTCALHNSDGCSTSCMLEPLHLCALQEDQHPGVPERSFCTFLSPAGP